jgi:hypothetical protein
MSNITTRVTAGSGATVKNAPLTNAEIDNNFINLNVDKSEKTANLSDLANKDTALSNLGGTSVGVAVFKAADAAAARSAIGAQAADANTAKLNVAQSFTEAQAFDSGITGTTVAVSGNISTSAGSVSDSKGVVRDVPQSGSVKTSSYTLQATDAGQLIVLSTGGSVTIPNSVLSTGNAVTIYNSTNAAITITCSIATAYISGTFTDKASVSLRAAGLMTVLFIDGTQCVLSGSIS